MIDIVGLVTGQDKADNYMENIIHFLQETTDAQITDIIKEII